MAHCEFTDTCSFLNEKMIEMPLTTCNLVESYCYGDFAMCAIYKLALTHGIENIPNYISPEDKYELSSKVIELVLWGKLGW